MSSKSLSGAAEVRGAPGALPRKARARMRRHVVRASQLSAVPPLQWWRRLPAHAFSTDHLDVLRRAFAGIGVVGEPRWADAVHGNAGAAVGIALRTLKKRRPLTPIVDLTMSTLLAPAMAGDAAATMVLLAMIERMGSEAEKEQLKHSWLDRQRKPSSGRGVVTGARIRMASGD